MGKLSDLALLAPTPRQEPRTPSLPGGPPTAKRILDIAEEKEAISEAITEALETGNHETIDVGLMSLDTLDQEEVIQETNPVSEEETSKQKQEDPMLQGLLDNIREKYNAGGFKEKLTLLNQLNNILE